MTGRPFAPGLQKYSPVIGIIGSTLALTDAASIAVDGSNCELFTLTLTGSHALANPTNLVKGARYVFLVKQDATGSRVLTYGNKYYFAGGTAPTLTTTAAAVDMLEFASDGTNLYLLNSTLALAHT
jgi:hypothetical protein